MAAAPQDPGPGSLGDDWTLLANALTDPLAQRIAVEVKEPACMDALELRLGELAGARPLVWESVSPGQDSAESLWRQARERVGDAGGAGADDPVSIPLLVITLGAWSGDRRAPAPGRISAGYEPIARALIPQPASWRLATLKRPSTGAGKSPMRRRWDTGGEFTGPLRQADGALDSAGGGSAPRA